MQEVRDAQRPDTRFCKGCDEYLDSPVTTATAEHFGAQPGTTVSGDDASRARRRGSNSAPPRPPVAADTGGTVEIRIRVKLHHRPRLPY